MIFTEVWIINGGKEGGGKVEEVSNSMSRGCLGMSRGGGTRDGTGGRWGRDGVETGCRRV
jgi:hypothetical protein